MNQGRLFEGCELRKIAKFSGRYGFLNNFFVEPDGTLVEREYQAAKCYNLADMRKFVGLGGRASKDLGQLVKRRADWYAVREDVMYGFTLQKYKDHRSLRERLLATEDWILEEGNSHGDTFWGTVQGIGENHLGRILMSVRNELR